MEFDGKFGHTLRLIQHIAIMRRIDVRYTAYHLGTQNVAPTITCFQDIKRCIQYLASHPHKYIFNYSNYYDGSNFIRLTWSGNQVEDYTTKNCL